MSDELKTPLTVKEHNWQYTSLYDSKGQYICQFDLEDLGEVTEDNQSELEAKQSRIVAAIVHRVNCHDKLVEALEDCIAELKASQGSHVKSVVAAKAALELAKGGNT